MTADVRGCKYNKKKHKKVASRGGKGCKQKKAKKGLKQEFL